MQYIPVAMAVCEKVTVPPTTFILDSNDVFVLKECTVPNAAKGNKALRNKCSK
jgi:hypothetical protein